MWASFIDIPCLCCYKQSNTLCTEGTKLKKENKYENSTLIVLKKPQTVLIKELNSMYIFDRDSVDEVKIGCFQWNLCAWVVSM